MDNMTKKAIWKGIAAIMGILIVASMYCACFSMAFGQRKYDP